MLINLYWVSRAFTLFNQLLDFIRFNYMHHMASSCRDYLLSISRLTGRTVFTQGLLSIYLTVKSLFTTQIESLVPYKGDTAMGDKNTMVQVKIDFLHNARPCIGAEKRSNITASFPVGEIPERLDIIQLDGITHPEGAFFVNHRVFSIRDGSLNACTLVLGVEGVHQKYK